MPIVYLQPSDLSAVQAARVLAFLNAASSAAQLDRDIEFPGEPDIGLRLGQRLLDARAALGGQFTDILQVRAIRLIGPERFTEICVAALGLEPTRWVELFYGGDPYSTPTETGLALTLALHPQDAWLGEPRTLRLQVNDHGGTPRAGVAVTVQTSIGRLVYLYGFRRIEGQAVTVLTGGDGSAELELLTPPSEPLTETQQAALETALGGLDAQAAHPLALEAGLRAMADTYLRDRSYSLRSAVDLYVRDAHGAAIDTISRARWKLAWPVDSGLIQADVLDAEDRGTSLARAVRTATWIDWVEPWVSFLADVLEGGTPLEQDLATRAKTGDGAVIDDLLNLAQTHLAGRAGRAAEWVGKRQVEAAVDRFIGSGVDVLPAAARDAVVSQLGVAAAEVGPRTLGSYTLSAATRQDLGQRIDTVAQLNLAEFEHIGVLAREVEARATAVDAQLRQVQELAQAVNQDRLAIDTRIDSFDTRYQSFDSRYASFDTRYSSFDSRYSSFDSRYASFDTRYADFDSRYTLIGTRLNDFDVRYGQFSTDVSRFNTDLATFDQNRVTLNTRIDSVDTNLKNVVSVNNLRLTRG